MNRSRGQRLTTQANSGLMAVIAISVPVNSQGRFLTPPATPNSSRMGRNT